LAGRGVAYDEPAAPPLSLVAAETAALA